MTAAELERRLFEVLGSWAPEVSEPAAKVLLRVHSFRHAAHAARWEELGADGPAGLDRAASLLEEVAGGPGDTGSRLTGAYRVVLPAVGAAYAGARATASAPVARALDAFVADYEDEMQAGARLFGRLTAMVSRAERPERQ